MGWVALGCLSLGKLLGDVTGGFLDRGLLKHADLLGRGLLGRLVGDEGGLLDDGLRVHADLLGGGLLGILLGDGVAVSSMTSCIAIFSATSWAMAAAGVWMAGSASMVPSWVAGSSLVGSTSASNLSK